MASEKHLEETSRVAEPQVLKALADPLVIDVRSAKEVEAAKGGAALPNSVNVPINVDGQPQSVHETTREEFRAKLEGAGVDLSSSKDAAFITHCTKGNTDYTGRGNRAAALLRDLGFAQAHNGGSADEIRTTLGLS